MSRVSSRNSTASLLLMTRVLQLFVQQSFSWWHTNPKPIPERRLVRLRIKIEMSMN